MPKGFFKGATESLNRVAPDAALMVLRQVLQEPRTQAELEMAQRRAANDENETRLQIELVREQIANSRSDQSYKAETRAFEQSPEQVELRTNERKARIDSTTALAEQRKARKASDERRDAELAKDPELNAFVASIRPLMEYAATPEEAGEIFNKAVQSFKVAREKSKPQAKAQGQGNPTAKAAPGKADPNAPVQMQLPDGRVVGIRADRVKDAESKGAKRVK